MTKAYQYHPLAHDEQQIRVLRFEQGQPDDDHLLRFKLESLTLHTDLQEPYYAISYAWGENPGLAPIIMDGREALVPDSAEEALRGILRAIRTDESHQATLIWIDAVCINQDDLEEKSHQVAMMGRVFAKAHLVFSWLGPDDGTTPAAIQSFEALQRQYRQLTGDQHDLNYLFNLPRYHCENLPFMRVAPPATPPVARVHANQQAVVHIGHEASNELHVQGVCVGEVVNLLDLEGNSNTTLLEWLVGVWSADLDTTNPKNTAAALFSGNYKTLRVDDATHLLPYFMAFINHWKDQCSPSTRSVLDRFVSKFELRGAGEAMFDCERAFKDKILFQLADGRVGVTYARLSRGDHICVLFGGRDAFVLRQEGPRHKIQGLAYIPDIHKGEYIDQLRAEGRLEEETQTFILT
ncbi:uncharacterized protein MYCFIDRAFT_80138 [Pseudocercospora fijiensis CIRAD86]|uniref:Heterokaryon incompatibility domain-containing protein n=1 Tax=Pseudocercospora fijiensis (strain CIRAD86) TaxID=383855 RepID=N1QBY6_PSEFD|nr:uncharacterized protein MYCFIDRAFT_80138 [Pseudocercospora fijiensis CIRAD86]EME88768.1 hypothetical protein MYCFIDRAFT_80138 [Pseudocercospora fijiensis CIRAD86]